MSNSYTWGVTQLECYPEYGGREKVVFKIGWARTATNGLHTVCNCGAQLIELKPDAPYTPYENLTFAQVISWLEDSMGEAALAMQIAALDKQIEAKLTPPTITLQPPWA